jgi:16S rRNA (adenine1518-N6/adenine1519-N6)-dimethyltransferase
MHDLNFRPSKKMGQSFLINSTIAKEIVDLINFNDHDCVIEIGPGKGALTKYLVNKPLNVVAIELDKRLSEYIKQTYKNIEVINDDVLKVDLNNILKKYKNPILLSNLPYSISSPFLFKYLSLQSSPIFICMLQKEFIERLIAIPKTKQYGGLSVVSQTYASIENLLFVDKNNFEPKPKVDSIVIRIQRNDQEFDNKFNEFVRRCFLAKRKTLFNNLKSNFQSNLLNSIFNQLGLDNKIRAEEITQKTFLKLYKLLNNDLESI